MQSPLFAKYLNSILIKAVISAGVLCIVFYFIPLTKVFDVILVANPFWVVAGALFQILLRVLTALRMQTIASVQELDISLPAMIRIVFTSTFYNILAPGALAGGAVTYVKYRQLGVRPVSAVTNIYANKLIELLVVSLPAPLFWFIDKGFSLYLILAYGLVMVVVFWYAFALFFGRLGSLQWLESKINRHGTTSVHRALTALCRQIGKIGQISHRVIFALLLYSAMYSLLAAVAILCFGYALNIEVGLLTILWVYPVIYLLAFLPISISNIGVREVSMILLLTAYGVTTTEAVAWSVLMYCGPLSCASIGLLMEAEHFWWRTENAQQLAPARQEMIVRHQNRKGGSNEGKSG